VAVCVRGWLSGNLRAVPRPVTIRRALPFFLRQHGVSSLSGFFEPEIILHSRAAPILRSARINLVKIITYALIAILVLLQYPLWLGSGGVLAVWRLKHEITAQKLENAELKERNLAVEADVNDLKQGFAAIEERARTELGMVKKGEVFYQVIEQTHDKSPPASEKKKKEK